MAIMKYKTKNGEVRYRATTWKDNRPLQSRSFRRRVDADQWQARELIKLEDEKAGRLKGVHTKLRTFFREIYFPNCGVREGTAKDYHRIFTKRIDPHFGDRMLNDLSPSDWAALFNSMKKQGIGSARLNRIHAVASAIYSLAVKWDYVNSNPLYRVDWEEEKLSGDHKYLAEDDLTKFLNFAHESSRELFPLYHFMYETGLRISEAIALQWDCVSLDQSTVEVRRAYSRIMGRTEQNTKSGHKRVLAFGPTMRETLLSLYNHKMSDYVFSKENGEMLAYETVRMRFAKDLRQTGVPWIGIHGLRHTFASHFMMSGGNLYDLKAILGHSSVETTMRYAHLSPKHLASKVSLVQFLPPQQFKVVDLKAPKHFPNIEESAEKKSDDSVSLRCP